MSVSGWSCAHKAEIGRVTPSESTPKGWNITSKLEAPYDTNMRQQEVMDIIMVEKRLEQTEIIEHKRRMPHAIKQMLTGRKDVSSSQPFGVAGHRPARPNERSLECSQIENTINEPSDQGIATHEACGHYPYRDWCRACVGGAGAVQTLTNDSGKNKTVYLWRAWIMGSSLIERNQRREMTPRTPREPLRYWW